MDSIYYALLGAGGAGAFLFPTWRRALEDLAKRERQMLNWLLKNATERKLKLIERFGKQDTVLRNSRTIQLLLFISIAELIMGGLLGVALGHKFGSIYAFLVPLLGDGAARLFLSASKSKGMIHRTEDAQESIPDFSARPLSYFRMS